MLEKERNNAEAYLLKGKIQLKLGDSAGSIVPIEQSIKLQVEDAAQGPPKANSFFYLGVAQEREKDYKKAMQNFKKALTIDNNHFGSCIHLANLLANLGEG